MIDDEQAPEELAPDPLAQIICEGCGREFQVVGTGDHQILFEPETGQSDPEYLICRCGCHLWVEEAEEGDLVRFEVAAGVFGSVGCDGDDLSAALRELLVPVPQLREMPAAERSHEAAQKDQDNGLPAQAGE